MGRSKSRIVKNLDLMKTDIFAAGLSLLYVAVGKTYIWGLNNDPVNSEKRIYKLIHSTNLPIQMK